MVFTAVRSKWIYRPHVSDLIENGLLVWQGRTIEYIGTYDKSKIPKGTDIYDLGKAILIPAFINSHTHIPEALLRGLIDDVPLETWLYDHIWKVEPMMDKADAVIGARLGIAEMISTGTIGFVDQFYYSEQIAKTVKETGVKAFLAPSIFDNNPETGSIEGAFFQNKRTFEKYNGEDDRLRIGVGPHALYSMELDQFQEIGEFAKEKNTLIHTHVLETELERKNALDTWGMSTVFQLEAMGLLDHTIAAHGVHCNEKDIQLLKSSNATVVHNLQSNLKLGSGVAPVPAFLDNAINLTIGTDGNASNNNLDMLEEMRTVSLVHKGLSQDPKVLPITEVLKMATVNAGQLLHDMYSGILEQGENCDFTVFDLSKLNSTPTIRPLSNLMFSIQSSNCVMTVANGSILYLNGKFKSLDIEETKLDAEKSIWKMIEKADYLL